MRRLVKRVVWWWQGWRTRRMERRLKRELGSLTYYDDAEFDDPFI